MVEGPDRHIRVTDWQHCLCFMSDPLTVILYMAQCMMSDVMCHGLVSGTEFRLSKLASMTLPMPCCHCTGQLAIMTLISDTSSFADILRPASHTF